MKTEHWTGEMPCNLNGFRNFEFLIAIYCLALLYHIFIVQAMYIKNRQSVVLPSCG